MTASAPVIVHEIEPLQLAEVLPFAENARTHSPAQVAQIARSIAEFGFVNPVLLDAKGVLVAGHGRLLAARALGMDIVPCIRLGHLTPLQARMLRIADNQLALNASWDDGLLAAELRAISAEHGDIDLLAFSDDQLSALLASSTAAAEGDDEVPEVPTVAVSRPGDLWVLGRHRIVCGDSTNREHLAALMQGKQADLCFTSPPYAQQRAYKAGGPVDWLALMQGVFSILPVKTEAQVLVNLGMVHRDNEWIPYWEGWVEWMRKAGWRRFGWYVWDQGPGLPGDWAGRLAPSHEFIFHFNRVAERARKTTRAKMAGRISNGGLRSGPGDATHTRNKGPSVIQARKIPDSVIRITRHKGGLPGDAGSHPAIFPVDLVSEMLTAFSDPDDLVFEPFVGSGTQLISAQKNGRSCYGVEIAPEYCDVAVRRWQSFAGQQAVLEATGASWSTTVAQRSAA